MKYTALIAEDNPVDLAVLTGFLGKYFPEVTIAGTSSSVKCTKLLLNDITPDILFLDVELTDGKSTELLEFCDNDLTQIIFATAFEGFAIDAIRAGAVDYIMKPVDSIQLKRAMLKAMKNLHDKRNKIQNSSGGKLALPLADGVRFVNPEDITRLEADGNYTKVYFAKDKMQLVSRALKDFEDKLDPHYFMRVHNRHIVNKNFIDKYVKGRGGQILMKDTSYLEVSEQKKHEFLKWMGE